MGKRRRRWCSRSSGFSPPSGKPATCPRPPARAARACWAALPRRDVFARAARVSGAPLATGSFAHERAKIDAALAAGVGGFIIFGGTREAITALTGELRQQAGRPLLIGADLERGPAQQAQE